MVGRLNLTSILHFRCEQYKLQGSIFMHETEHYNIYLRKTLMLQSKLVLFGSTRAVDSSQYLGSSIFLVKPSSLGVFGGSVFQYRHHIEAGTPISTIDKYNYYSQGLLIEDHKQEDTFIILLP